MTAEIHRVQGRCAVPDHVVFGQRSCRMVAGQGLRRRSRMCGRGCERETEQERHALPTEERNQC